MSMLHPRSGNNPLFLALGTFALTGAMLTASPAIAGGDRDHDGMPNRWEARNGLNPTSDDAAADKDHDGLTNLEEYRHGGDPRDEDSDNDGHDDGDEIHDRDRGTRINDRDSDDDGVLDGDEDSDHDGIDNEDEDDASESCRDDDGDRDDDDLSDEDENDYRTRANDADTDDDGIFDGNEDYDDDGQSNEDDDDSDDDRCDDADEDDDDLLGPIVSFDEQTGLLVIDTVQSGATTFTVTDDTEIEYDSSGPGSGEDADTSDLVPGAVVNEVDLEDDGTLEEVELARR